MLLSTCVNNKIKTSFIEELLDYIDVCKIPKFPFSGNFLKEQGYEAGPELGKKLKSLEERWINNNFVIDKKMLEKSLGKTK